MVGGGFQFDPQLGEFLRQSGMLEPSKAKDERSIQQRREDFAKPFRYILLSSAPPAK